MKWFKHQSDSNMNAKLQEVLLDYGVEGYGLYWYCLELVAQNVASDNLTFELKHDARVIGRNIGLSAVRVEEIMKAFIDKDLFSASEGRIQCLKLAARCDDFTSKALRSKGVKPLTNQSVGVCRSLSDKNPLEEEEEEEKNKDIGDKSPQVPLQEILNAYHDILSAMPKVQVYTEKRKAMVRTFFKKRSAEQKKNGLSFGVENVISYFKYIAEHCQWMTEARPNSNGGMWKVKNFDYVMKEDCYVAVKEQRHDDIKQT